MQFHVSLFKADVARATTFYTTPDQLFRNNICIFITAPLLCQYIRISRDVFPYVYLNSCV